MDSRLQFVLVSSILSYYRMRADEDSLSAAYLMAGLLLIANLLMRPRSLPPTARSSTCTLLVKFSTEPAMWLVCCGVFCVMAALFVPMFYIQGTFPFPSLLILTHSLEFIAVFVRSHDFNPTLATYSVRPVPIFSLSPSHLTTTLTAPDPQRLRLPRSYLRRTPSRSSWSLEHFYPFRWSHLCHVRLSPSSPLSVLMKIHE
jgi:hypothetical protein